MVKSLFITWLVFAPTFADLGSDDYETRERAEARLQQNSRLTAPLCLAYQYHPDLEIQKRTKRVLERAIGPSFRPIGEINAEPRYVYYGVESPDYRCYSCCHFKSPHWVLFGISCETRLARVYFGRIGAKPVEGRYYGLIDHSRASECLAKDLLLVGFPASAIKNWLREREQQ